MNVLTSHNGYIYPATLLANNKVQSYRVEIINLVLFLLVLKLKIIIGQQLHHAVYILVNSVLKIMIPVMCVKTFLLSDSSSMVFAHKLFTVLFTVYCNTSQGV